MKLSISNIAWFKEEDSEVYKLMRDYGFIGLDVAPKRVIEDPFNASNDEIEKARKEIENQTFSVIGMQALLYGHPELRVFESDENRRETLEYLKRIMDYAAKLGAKVLVFGSPKNRQIGNMDYQKAEKIAISFFNELGEYAKEKNMYFCIEPNPTAYGADFITNTRDAIKFVEKVNNDGFRLHVDMGTIIMNNEDIETVIKEATNVMEHFHISQPYLNLITKDIEKHKEVAKALKKFKYNGYVSIEMKNGITTPNINAVKEALEFISKIYGGEN